MTSIDIGSAGGTSPPRTQPTVKAVPVRHPWRWVAAVVIAVLVAMFAHMLATNPAFQWSFVWQNLFTPPVLAGARTTVILTVLAMVIGIALGTVLAVMRLSPNPILSGVSFVYTWFFRAVPRLVLCVVFGVATILYQEISLGVPFDRQIGRLFGASLDTSFYSMNMRTLLSAFMAGLLALALSEAAYMAEIVRAGIGSVGEGQTEAATALGMSRGLTMRRIVLPQAMRVIVPPTGNEVIAMLKDTSLVAYVPLADLFFNYEAIGARTFQVFPALVAAVIWYLALTSVLLVGQYFIEKRFARGTSRGTPGPGIRGRLIASGGTHGH
jgi:polar amino acid transport system permease protein